MNSNNRDKDFSSDALRKGPFGLRPSNNPNRRARPWQVAMTLVAAIVIVWVVLYGLTNQRDETQPGGGQQQAATQITPNAQGNPPPGGNAPTQGNQQQTQGNQPSNQPGGQQQAAQPQPGPQPGQANTGSTNREATGSGTGNNQNANADQNATPQNNSQPRQSNAQ